MLFQRRIKPEYLRLHIFALELNKYSFISFYFKFILVFFQVIYFRLKARRNRLIVHRRKTVLPRRMSNLRFEYLFIFMIYPHSSFMGGLAADSD